MNATTRKPGNVVKPRWKAIVGPFLGDGLRFVYLGTYLGM